MGLRGPKARPVVERFAEKIAPGENGCIEWQAGTNGVGYGVFHPNTTTTNKKAYAHRWAYEQRFGPIPEGLHLDHLCRNTICVNPDHLEPVTVRENLLRGVGATAKNARKTECQNGHPLSGSNLRVNPTTGYRGCKKCIRAGEVARQPDRNARNRAKRAAQGSRPRIFYTECRYGHAFTEENLYINPRGVRVCRECNRIGYHKNKKES